MRTGTLCAGLAFAAAAGCSAPEPAGPEGPAVELRLGSTRGLTFEPAELSAPPGRLVRLTFRNGSRVHHNFVLTRPGLDHEMAALGAETGERGGFLPHSADALAHTRLLEPGERQTISFRTPSEPGDYPFLCTVEGHSMMRGTLTVR